MQKKKVDYSPAYLGNDPQHCFLVALTESTWTQPWKALLTITSHPWANQKAVQNNGLLLGSCHLRAARNKMGVCLDMTMVGTPSPPVMEDNTGKGENTQKQVESAPENVSPDREKSLMPLKDVDCVHNIHNRNFYPFATNKRPDKGLNQTMLWVESEVHMFLISAHLCTVPALPSLTVPELSTIMFSQTNCSNPCI